ncbi:MAG: hypothetical protein EOO75_14655 [Myxococcales bacterium]|nr:MAG: hypothetical protein EOO75_14655 [Myxococcales bacterium]
MGAAAAALAFVVLAWLGLRLGGSFLLDARLLPLVLGGGWLAARWRSRPAGAAALVALVGMGTLGLVVGQSAEVAPQVQARGVLLASVLPTPVSAGDLAPSGHGP